MKQLPRTFARTALPSLTCRSRWATHGWVGLCACGLAVSASICLAGGAAHAQSTDQAHARAAQTRAAASTQPGAAEAPDTKATDAKNTPPSAAQAKDTPSTKQAPQGKRDGAKGKGKSRDKRQDEVASADKAAKPAAPHSAPAPQQQAPAPEAPTCQLRDNEQPRGGRLDVIGGGADRFGSAPVVRIAGKPARILVRKQDRISVQVPVDSDGGEISLLDEGKVSICGELVIIGKNR